MTQNDVDEFDFSGSQGAAVAEESNKAGDFQREVEFLRLLGDQASVAQGKDTAIVRLLTEHEVKPWMQGHPTTRWNFAWVTVKQHYVRTKQKPPYAREGSQWPEKMYAVCRRDKIFAKKYDNDCYNCSQQGHKPSDRTWALGIEREKIIEDGKWVGLRDKTREVTVFDDNGEAVVERVEGDKKIYAKKTVPAYVILNFGWKNFFHALHGQATWNQTVLDRDYAIKRSGTGNNDTNYTFIPLDPIILPEGNEYGLPAGTKYDLGMVVAQEEGTGRPQPLMEFLYPEMPDLRRIIRDRTTDEYYGRWFVPGWVPEGFDPSAAGQQGSMQQGSMQQGGGYTPQGGQSVPSQPQTPTPQGGSAPAGPTENALAGLRERLMGAKQQ